MKITIFGSDLLLRPASGAEAIFLGFFYHPLVSPPFSLESLIRDTGLQHLRPSAQLERPVWVYPRDQKAADNWFDQESDNH
jgi:hypothetical protein